MAGPGARRSTYGAAYRQAIVPLPAPNPLLLCVVVLWLVVAAVQPTGNHVGACLQRRGGPARLEWFGATSWPGAPIPEVGDQVWSVGNHQKAPQADAYHTGLVCFFTLPRAQRCVLLYLELEISIVPAWGAPTRGLGCPPQPRQSAAVGLRAAF